MSVSRFAGRLLWHTGLATAARRILTREGRFVVSFHGVAGRRDDALARDLQPSFSVPELRTALDWIGRRFRFLTPGELLAGDWAGVLLTFDDGYANHCTQVLPVLEDFAAPAVFFVTTQHVACPRDWLPAIREQVRRRWPRVDEVPGDVACDYYDGMTPEQLRFCARHPLIEIGSHTVHHPFLSRCDDATLKRELVDSRYALEGWSGGEVDLFAYPTGDYDLRVARAVGRAGYRAAFAENSVGVGLPAYEIPRIGLYDCAAPYLGAKLSGLHRRPLRVGTSLDAVVEIS